MRNRLLSLFMTMVMVCSIVPLQAFAQEEKVEEEPSVQIESTASPEESPEEAAVLDDGNDPEETQFPENAENSMQVEDEEGTVNPGDNEIPEAEGTTEITAPEATATPEATEMPESPEAPEITETQESAEVPVATETQESTENPLGMPIMNVAPMSLGVDESEPKEVGSFLVAGEEENYSYSEGVLEITGGSVEVANIDQENPTTDRIYIKGEATVTLAGVNISTGTGAPVEVDDHTGTNAIIILEGENSLISQCNNKAGLHKSRGQSGGSDTGTLIIRGDGSLTAVGGYNAAGIGAGGHKGDVKGLTIESGTITAVGNGDATGIGASDQGSVWELNITGGKIQATGADGYGIGASWNPGVLDANITGGFVTANGYHGNPPTGGIVSLDNGATYNVYGDQTLAENVTVPEGTKWFIGQEGSLTIADGYELDIQGELYNEGSITGNVVNTGAIYNGGTVPSDLTGTVYTAPYLEVRDGSYSGQIAEGGNRYYHS